ncbi:hypothetical protein [uncultured Oscillibacter sp.]|uniref:hypothetical protein n=1 Tax=uncultured Oscillibacter sp. TaxID=876091 RepID=UPI002601AC3A|nr:hypothetical protein [uncultured Oscillibacter sp.]
MGVRTVVKLAVFLALLALFLLVEYRLRRSGRVPGPAAFAALIAVSLFCSALLSQIVADAFAPVWEGLEESEAPAEDGGSKASGAERTAKNLPDNTLQDSGEEEFLFDLEDEPVPMAPAEGE